MALTIQRPSATRYARQHHSVEDLRKKQLPRKLAVAAYGITIVILGLVGMLVQDVTFGRILLVSYGIIALGAKIPSADTFKMALVAMLTIIILAFLGNTTLIKNFAEYAFLLLAIGVICTAAEMRRTHNYRR